MTRRALMAQADHLESLVGEVCVRAGTGAYPWALLLDFGVLHTPDSTGYREPEKALVVECPWRLETSSQVIVGSGDYDGTITAGEMI